ncbi:right-handed parallel beta-helix repeat-containing protein [Pseudalkalibacillus caeni]|uniref:PKD domain-containing protein n=1 Tax=Exobacillus caeni TaxID=2574798 RepID=A0A5R9F5R9_9BACL|nr:right-handed parallel beta-helix repeat-containing protein [Pseudalkalibacillus caeni]TLS38391.1 PKD domain-containing protein [Pseudalkalibacillus caeni]
MKQLKKTILLLLMFLLVCPPFTGAVADSPEETVIDLSHDSPASWGYTFGTKDEVKRWQTFTATGNGTITNLGLLLREKAGEGQLSNLVVELYKTSNHLPVGEPLKAESIAPQEVTFDQEWKFPFLYEGLESGQQYAVALTQATLSADGGMHNYSWPAKSINSQEHFGKFAGGKWVDESGIGDGWLKVYADLNHGEVVISELDLSEKYVNLKTDETTTLTATAIDQFGEEVEGAEFNWNSSDEQIAVVSDGEITALAEGTAEITATSNGVEATASVMVSDAEGVIPVPGMELTEDTTFKPGFYDFTSGDGLTIGKDNITIDGNGAILLGPGKESNGPDSFSGIGLLSEGHSGINIKNLTVNGFKVGLHAIDGSNWRIENNNFSNNFTDPEYGWGDGEEYGAVFLERITNSVISQNKGNNVWNGLNLKYSDGNKVTNNDFSHTTNVSLKMWNASNNEIVDNNFSYGIRIAPGEVHARDSTSLLMESGSNENKLIRNDFTHGGDGIFIRVLNGWVSTGNYFEENDASYANNNAVESWSPGNTYVRNKANHSSYGFWLGGSDDTVLIENEAAFNGIDFNNAPEAFGNAGIAVVNGASSHFKLVGNHIHDNNGPGVAIRYNEDYPAYHWVIQQNTIENNKNDPRGYKGHGIYIKNAKWLDIAGNNISGNEGEPIHIDSNVSDVFQREASIDDTAPVAEATLSSTTVTVGETITFDATSSTDPKGAELGYRWDLGDDTIERSAIVDHTYSRPGFYRVGLTVNNGKLADLAFFNVYVVEKGEEIGSDQTASKWELDSDKGELSLDESQSIQGDHSITVKAREGTTHQLTYPASKNLAIDASKEDQLSFWIKYHSEYGGDQSNRKPVVRLMQDENNYIEYTPNQAYLDQLYAPISEQRYGWKRLIVPLHESNGEWTVETVGEPSLDSIDYLEFGEGPSTSGISEFWIDGIQLQKQQTHLDRFVDIAKNTSQEGFPKPISSIENGENSDMFAPLNGDHDFDGSNTEMWNSLSGENDHEEDWYGVEFGSLRELNRIDVYFYHNPSGSIIDDNLWKPKDYQVEYWAGDGWRKVFQPKWKHNKPQPNLNRIEFLKVKTSKIRVKVDQEEGKQTGIYSFEAYNTTNAAANRYGERVPVVKARSSVSENITLNEVGFLLNEKGTNLSDIKLELYNTEENTPVGDPLEIVTVTRDNLNAGEETKAEFNFEGLEPGKQYAIAITQDIIAANGLEDHYRWPTRSADSTEHFGKFVRDNWVDESFLGMGWLKLYTSQGLIDYSFENPGSGGYGVGHVDEEKRWQTFTIPTDAVWEVIDGSIQESNGWESKRSDSGQDWVEVEFNKEKIVYKSNLFLDKVKGNSSLPEAYQLQYWKDNGWRDIDRFYKTPIKAGLNTVFFKPVKTSKMRVLVSSATENIHINEWEVIELKISGLNEIKDKVNLAYDTNLIDSKGLTRSIESRLNKLEKKPDKKTLKALENHIRAQKGKHIDEEFAVELLCLLDTLR